MEKSASKNEHPAKSDILVIDNTDASILRFKRGIEFWKNDIALPPIKKALSSVSSAFNLNRWPKDQGFYIFDERYGLKIFENHLDYISSVAFAIGVGGSTTAHEIIEKNLMSIRMNIITPFAWYIKMQSENIVRAESFLEATKLIREAAEDKDNGSVETLKKLERSASHLMSLRI